MKNIIIQECEDLLLEKSQNIVQEFTLIEIGIIAAIAVLLKRVLGQCNRKCGVFKFGSKKKICVANCKIAAYTQAIQYAKSQLVKCSQSPNQIKCTKKINNTISKLQIAIGKQNEIINKYKMNPKV